MSNRDLCEGCEPGCRKCRPAMTDTKTLSERMNDAAAQGCTDADVAFFAAEVAALERAHAELLGRVDWVQELCSRRAAEFSDSDDDQTRGRGMGYHHAAVELRKALPLAAPAAPVEPKVETAQGGVDDLSTVRRNLLTVPGYAPYCGAPRCRRGMPRTRFNGEQFECACGWQSAFEPEFIARYKATHATPPAPVGEMEEAARLVAEHAAKMKRAPGLEPLADALDLAARALRSPLLNLLTTPEGVHLAMVRGFIPTISLANALHLHGDAAQEQYARGAKPLLAGVPEGWYLENISDEWLRDATGQAVLAYYARIRRKVDAKVAEGVGPTPEAAVADAAQKAGREG